MISKIERGEICKRDVPALHQLVKGEVRVSLLLAAREVWLTCVGGDPIKAPAGRRFWPAASPMIYATLMVVVPPGVETDQRCAEGLTTFSWPEQPVQVGRRQRRELSAPEQRAVALWLRANLLKAGLGDPTGLALRHALTDEWIKDPPPHELRKPGPEQAEFLARFERLVQLDMDLPMIRGHNNTPHATTNRWHTSYTNAAGEIYDEAPPPKATTA